MLFRSACIILTALLIVVSPLLVKNVNESFLLRKQRRVSELFYAVEGAVDDGIDQFVDAVANFTVSATTSRWPAAGTLSTNYTASTAFPAGVAVSWYVDDEGSLQQTVTDPDGTQVLVKTFVVHANGIHPDDASVTLTMHQLVRCRLIYTFQHAVFYNDDLEILPGPDMNFAGRIHSNEDIYMDSHNTLTVDSEYLRCAGDIYNYRKDNGAALGGDVDIRVAGTTNYAVMNGLDSDDGNWMTESQTRWNGTVQTGDHGVTPLSVPVVGSVQPGGYYHTNADVVVINDVITQGGVTLTEGVDIPAGTIVTDTDFYNNRESRYVRMTNIDMRRLAGYAPGDPDGSPSFPDHLPANGLMYATRDDAPAGQQPGIRLTNGERIYRTGGVTVVSNDPVYIQGDFNTDQRQPSSVICDAINILSNNWNDSTSTLGLGNRIANETMVNLAFISGIDTTTAGNYNGGLENYPRFHENWSGVTFNITGAFVELWNSQIAQGQWNYGSPQYTAPRRDWSYDTSFGLNNMPPFTPWAVSAEKGAWWTD